MQNYTKYVNWALEDTVASPTWLLFLGHAPICLDEKSAALKVTDGEKKKRLMQQQLPTWMQAKLYHYHLTFLHVLASHIKSISLQTTL